ncbi:MULTISPECIES: anti-sigma factor [unclassified Nocardioides]|uniref:anti-sigma factor n=1 Tax=unclassified Nocardioides TaxID=2615069 RepID=UPI003606A98B
MSDIHALSGAYAVDALDDIERASFERHLTDCPACRAEVAELREAAAMLSETTATQPPAGLRDRVLADAARVRPLPPETPPSVERPRHRRRSLLLAAAAAVVALGAGAAVVSQQPWEDAPPTATQAVLDAADAASASIDFPDGSSATVTHSDSLGQAVIVTHDMAPPPDGKVYQVWLDQPGEGMVSAGLMPERADQTVLLEGDAATATGAGITVEPAGGSEEPTTEPIALFDFETPDA